MTTIRLRVNDDAVTREVENRTLLVELLRDSLGLTGTHVGCDTSQCGCCVVLVDGRPAKSCTVLAVQVDGAAVTTIEGLARRPADGGAPALHPLQQAFIDCHALQCGFCTPGMVMSAAALLAGSPAPSDEEIVHALEGNLCRCTGYNNIVAAVRQAADELARGGADGLPASGSGSGSGPGSGSATAAATASTPAAGSVAKEA
ncbi:MAG: (2Fe-2S)-binding protein [Burkholderiales bacterium]|nr:(2Fe-2S)-binding protein [Burkholderiales bacterium]OJX04081.1 MAG: carbon monoxide dehydrogenase [Burkholderiales bacterium 70-64]